MEIRESSRDGEYGRSGNQWLEGLSRKAEGSAGQGDGCSMLCPL